MGGDPQSAELARALDGIRARVAERYPSGPVAPGARPELRYVDLLPVLHARDAAEAKVAAIGGVNPRRGGVVNGAIQSVKRAIARGLGWFVRDQVEFNRAAVAAQQAVLDALNDFNRLIRELNAELHAHVRDATGGLPPRIEAVEAQAARLADVHAHWLEWRTGWEKTLAENELKYLRAAAELERFLRETLDAQARQVEGRLAGFAQELSAGLARADAFVQQEAAQHRACSAELAQATDALQQRFWQELRAVRAGYEKLIHDELRTLRQRAALLPPPPAAPASAPDNLRFAEVFRGSAERVRASLAFYLPHFAGCRNVLDIGCGRGEFLAAAREAGIGARGIDLDAECVALAQAAGGAAEVADLFAYLGGLNDRALDGILAAHIVEHLAPERLPVFIELAARKLASGALLAIETPNPRCLATFATYFYADPTHVRPVPDELLAHYLRESGFGLIETVPRQPAVELFPSLAALPEAVRDDFFGAMDYAILARRL